MFSGLKQLKNLYLFRSVICNTADDSVELVESDKGNLSYNVKVTSDTIT